MNTLILAGFLTSIGMGLSPRLAQATPVHEETRTRKPTAAQTAPTPRECAQLLTDIRAVTARRNFDAARFRQLVKCPGLADLTSLDLAEIDLGPNEIRALASSRYSRNLTSIRLEGGPEILRELHAQNLRKLTSVTLAPYLEHVSLTDLANSPDSAILTGLDLSHAYNYIGYENINELRKLNSPNFRNLRSLNLWESRIGDRGVAILAGLEHLRGLTSLNLGASHISSRGVRALASSPYLRNLSSLDLSTNGGLDNPEDNLGPAGARILASSPSFQNLVSLRLTDSEIGPEGVRSIAGSPHLRNLTDLAVGNNGLRGNRLNREDARALINSRNFGNLKTLAVSFTDHESVMDLIRSGRFPKLVEFYNSGAMDLPPRTGEALGTFLRANLRLASH